MSVSALPAIQTNKQGLILPTNVEELFRWSKGLSMSGMLPDRYAGKAEMVMTASQMCIELGLPAINGLAVIAVIKGTPCLFGNGPLGLVQASGKLEWIKEGIFNEAGKEICLANGNLTDKAHGAFCVVKRKGDPEVREAYFNMSEAKDAGLLGNPTWKNYPKTMLKYRARSQALRDKFADILMGVRQAEDFDVTEAEILEAPKDSAPVASGLAEKLARKTAVIEVEDSNDGVSIHETQENEDSNE